MLTNQTNNNQSTIITPTVPYVVLAPMGQESNSNNQNHFVLMGPLDIKQLATLGIVKDSSITTK